MPICWTFSVLKMPKSPSQSAFANHYSQPDPQALQGVSCILHADKNISQLAHFQVPLLGCLLCSEPHCGWNILEMCGRATWERVQVGCLLCLALSACGIQTD